VGSLTRLVPRNALVFMNGPTPGLSARRLKSLFSPTTGHRTTGAVHGEGGVGIVVLVPPDNMLFTLATICNLGGS